jgi:hypothetical protein
VDFSTIGTGEHRKQSLRIFGEFFKPVNQLEIACLLHDQDQIRDLLGFDAY